MTIEQINTLGLLSGLVATCGGSHYGYTAAVADLRDPKLKPLFIALGEQRASFMRDLQELGERFGGVEEEAAELEATSGKWKPVHAAVAEGDPQQILQEFIHRENAAVETYSRALHEEKVMPDAIELARRQREAIVQAREQLRKLRDVKGDVQRRE